VYDRLSLKCETLMTRTIQRAIRRSGLTLNQIGRAAGIDSAQMSRFMRDKQSITIRKAEQLCRVLKLELGPARSQKD
jgi:transcriptional regulator with XRE-family HTH domain